MHYALSVICCPLLRCALCLIGQISQLLLTYRRLFAFNCVDSRGTITWDNHVGQSRGTITWENHVGQSRGTITWDNHVGQSRDTWIQLPLKRSSRFQRLSPGERRWNLEDLLNSPNPSWLVWGRASRHQKLAPTFPGMNSCLVVIKTKRDFFEMEASLWLNGKTQNVTKGWLSI